MTMARILIVEDDGAIAELERDYFEAARFEVETVGDGAEALALAHSRKFDLFVVDLMLPGLDGFSLCKELRAVSQRPILVVSARGADLDKVQALGIGADDYVTKPFSPAELVARVRAHLERYERLAGRADAAVISSGDLTIDTERKAVLLGGQPVALTATEYDILLILAQHPGTVFSKEQLFEKIRGEGFYGETSAITVHVRRLREKIEENPSEPKRIETVWGMGYRFAG
jgi:DNA-binding response OmpR family regulator